MLDRRRVYEVVIAPPSGQQEYWQQMQSLFGSRIIDYFPHWEPSGTTATDIVNGNNGTYKATGVSYGVAGIGDGKTGVTFNGLSGALNMYSTGLKNALNGQEFSFLTMVKIPSTTWANGAAFPYILSLLADAQNKLEAYIGPNNNQLSIAYRAANTAFTLGSISLNDQTWIPLVFSVSKTADRARSYIQGSLLQEKNSLTSWAGQIGLNYCWLGANQPGTNLFMNASFQHTLFINGEVTPAEVASYSQYALINPYFVSFGDSRTVNRGYQDAITTGLNTATGQTWKEIQLAISGSTSISWTTGTPKVIDSRLAMTNGNVRYVMYNLGVNDVPATSESDFKTNTLYILDAMHARFPVAKILMMRIWKAGSDTPCATLNGWIDYCIAQRSSFAVAGPDESVWAKGLDNGATMYSDGVHYSAAGKAEAANQWLATIAALP